MNAHKFLMIALTACLTASASVPFVSNVTATQDACSRRVTVVYTLSDEPGIITLTAQTNCGDNVWIDVDDANLTHVSGDANKIISVGEHSLTWLPHKSWPDQIITGGNIRIGVKAWATNAPPDYMVVSLVSAKAVSFYTSAAAIPGGVQAEKYKTDYLVLRKIPAGHVTWRMGSPATPSEKGRKAERETPHEVTLTDDYYIGVYPVTQRQYQRIMNKRPANFCLDSDYMTRPVEKVSFDDIRGKASDGYSWPYNAHAVSSSSFMGVLRSLTGLDGFDLPTDAQWEFACRAGSGSALYNGTELESETTSANLSVLARYAHNGGKPGGKDPASTCTAEYGTAKVGSYEPNAWGLYDMLGNTWDWCLDWYQESPVGYDASTGPASGSSRVIRGGSWLTDANSCRCAYRGYTSPSTVNYNYGFRVACSIGLH